jgi:hypothetical protein
MADLTFGEVYDAARRLPPDEQTRLVEQLQSELGMGPTSAPPGTLAAALEAAERANIGAGKPVDIARHSREILKEREEHLTRWMNEDADERDG